VRVQYDSFINYRWIPKSLIFCHSATQKFYKIPSFSFNNRPKTDPHAKPILRNVSALVLLMFAVWWITH
jgi:hypothetical protein